MLSSLAACGVRADAADKKLNSGVIVLLTDGEEAQDSTVVSSVWKGICAYGEKTGSSYLRINALDANQEGRLTALQNGMEPEVKVVVCIGPAYESVVFEAQKTYPDVMFLLLDGEPHRENSAVYETTTNTHCVLYQETQAGFLAGYAAVLEGNTKLGFCGESADPAVIRYGYGFIEGADLAATRLGLRSGAIEIQYWYAGTGQTAEVIQRKVAGWYQGGTQLVLACNNGNPEITQNVIAAAEASGGRVFGADADRASESETVICSVVKNFETSVKYELALLEYNEGRWDADHAGRTMVLGVKEDAVRFLYDPSSWKFNKFTIGQYQDVLGQMIAGSIPVDQSSSQKLFPAVSICSIIDQGEG
jgi:basic membrane protein A